MPVYDTFRSLERDLFHSSYGRDVLYHLTADGACFLRGEVAVVAIGKVNANFACSLHLELVKSTLSAGNKSLLRPLFYPDLFVLSILKSASANVFAFASDSIICTQGLYITANFYKKTASLLKMVLFRINKKEVVFLFKIQICFKCRIPSASLKLRLLRYRICWV